MLRVIYKLAQGDFDTTLEKSNERSESLYPIVQVNVEDPAPGFTCLRDLVDYMMFLENQEWQNLLFHDDNQDCGQLRLQEIAGRAKLAPRQVQIVRELLHLRKLLVEKRGNSYTLATVVSGDSADDKQFRLTIKERLYKENKSAISSLPTKSEMRDEISQLFNQQMKHYERILAKAHGESTH